MTSPSGSYDGAFYTFWKFRYVLYYIPFLESENKICCNSSHTDNSLSPVLLWGTKQKTWRLAKSMSLCIQCKNQREDTQLSLRNVSLWLWPLNGHWCSTQINVPYWKERRAFRPFVLSDNSNANPAWGHSIYVPVIDLGTKPRLHQAKYFASGVFFL